jgi:hypothetical protein
VVTESGAGCTSGACSPVQNTAFPGRACHVAGRAGPAEARDASQLLGNRRVPGAGTPGYIAELQGAGWAEMY